MTYKSTHPPGAKTILLALGLLLGPLVAACSGGTAATAEGDPTPATTSTPSFAPVDFDKDAPGFDFFNACREFTDQDYSDLALELDIPDESSSPDSFSGCILRDSDGHLGDAGVGIISDLSTQQAVLSKTQPIITSFESRNTGAYFHSGNQIATDEDCMVSVPTQGGRLGVFAFTIVKQSPPQDELCKLSDDLLFEFLEKAEQKR